MATAKVPVTFSPVDSRKVDAALARIQSKAKGVDFGGGARSLDKLSRPLGKITGQASEFQKSLEASNARVLAFGASVAVINKLSQAFGALVSNTIKVEATFAKINTILGGTQKQLEQFGNGIFKVAQQTGTSFDQVAEGALELARQGLGVEESLNRVGVALKLVRVSGIDAEKAVGGLTAAIKGFQGAGLNVAQIADKLAEVDTKFAVSTEDLINGLERASASARVAGVDFDELLAVITTVQERTQRGGAVIGNAFKTIFARLGRTDTLAALEELGIQVLDSQGNVRDAIPLFKELAVELDQLGLKSVKAGDIIQKVAGVRQRDILISLVEDLNSGQSQFAKALQVSATAAGALDSKNAKLNDTLEALINNLTVGGQKLASVLGDIGFTDAAKDILKAFSFIVSGITDILQGDSIGAKFAQGLIKGIGSVLTGPGIALVGAIFLKLFFDLAKFGASSLKSILGINKAAQQQQALQQSVLQTLFQNENIQREILALEGNKVAQEQLLLKIYNQQAAALARVQKVAATVTPGLFGAGLRGGEKGVTPKTKRAAGGYIAAESRDVSRGVGGAPSSAKVVSIPNFAFGGGKRGTMVANTSEYVIPNYAGGGDAIFNQDMVKTMGLPAGAKKLNAAGGFIPNFASKDVSKFGFLVPQLGLKRPIKPLENVSIAGKKTTLTGITARGIVPGQAQSISDPIENRIRKSVINESAAYAKELKPLGRTVSKADIESGFGTIAGAKGALQAAIGSAFEVAITKALDYKSAIREKGGDFDIRGGVNLSRIQKLFGLPKTTSVADLKVSDSPGNVESFYSKILKEINASRFGETEKRKNARKIATQQVISKYPESFTSKGGLRRDINPSERDRLNKLINRTSKTVFRGRFGNASAAGGYIPNFAGGALEEAISREKDAGLPISQIRINQSGKLRNAKNPMGLAVTNTRDEPTGAIPNFAKPPGEGGGGGVLDSNIAKFFALQLAVSALTSTVTEQDSTMAKFGSAASSAINTLLVLSTVGVNPLGGFGKKGKLTTAFKGGGFKGLFKSFGRITGVLGKLRAVAGPVALGFTAINLAFKTFLGKGVFQVLGEKLGLLATDAEKAGKRIAESTSKLGTEGNQGAGVISNLDSARSEILLALKEQRVANELGTNKKDLVKGAVRGKAVIDSLLGEEGAAQRFFGGEKVRTTSTSEKSGTSFNFFKSLSKTSSELIQDAISENVFLSVEEVTEGFKEKGKNITSKSAKDILEAQREAVRVLDESLTREMFEGGNDKEDIAKIIRRFNVSLVTAISRAVEEAEEPLKNVPRVEAKEASRQVSLAGSRRQNSISISAARTEALRANINRIPAGSVEKVSRSFASESDQISTKNKSDRLQVRQKLLEQVKLGESINAIEKEQLDIILSQVTENGSIEEIAKSIENIQGLNVENLDDLVQAAKLQNTQLEDTLKTDKAILEIRKKQAIETAKSNKGLAKYTADAQQRLIDQAEDLPNVLARNFEESLASTFDRLATGAYDTVGDAFLDIAVNFGEELQKQLNQRAATQATGALLNIGKGSGGGDGIGSKVLKGIGSIFSRGSGGGGGGGGAGGGGFFGSLKSIVGLNSGGIVTGGSGVRDDIPAALTGGEYVIKKSAVQKYGKEFFDQLNSKGINKMQQGGFFIPGTRNQGQIKGKKDLLAFASQEYTSGRTDKIKSSGSGASIDLEDQSARLTTFGRFRDSPARRALKEAQLTAYNLYLARLEEEQRVRDAKKQRSEMFQNAIKGAFSGAIFSAGVGVAGNLFSGANTGLSSTSTTQSAFNSYSSNALGGYNVGSTQAGTFQSFGGGTSVNVGLTGNTPSFNLGGGQSYNPSLNYGGYANGGNTSRDSNSLLMGGEYVLSKSAASELGKETLDNINMTRYASGGAVGAVASKSSDSPNKDGADVGEVNITINMENGGASVDASSNENADPTQTKEFAKRIKDVVIGVINEEKRVSGSLFTRRK